MTTTQREDLTQEGRFDLQSDLNELQQLRRPALSEALHATSAPRDLRENVDYQDAKEQLTVEQYLAWEEDNLEKHEYINGEVRCMAGANRRHIGMVWNIATFIGSQIDESRCSVLIAEMKVKSAGPRGIYYLYPDICFVCGEERYESASEVVLLNPDLVVEVTSAATRGYDRSDKRDLYFAIASIQAYLIIDQHQIQAELHTRRRLDWRVETYSSPDDIIPLPVLDCSLPLARAYRSIKTDL